MSAKDDGGAAFPLFLEERAHWNDGMSMRDYFAAAALQGLLSDISENIPCLDQSNPLPEQLKWSAYKAQSAYRLADAMLKERMK